MFEIFILSLVQGITEFLPISSSSHLLIFSSFGNFENQNVNIDISLHIGSFIAVICFFYKDLINFIKNKELFFKILISSIPVMIVGGFLIQTNLIEKFRSIEVIAWTTLIFGIFLYFADQNKFNKKISSDLDFKKILYIGLFQTLALIPGVSRAGVTITIGRMLKFNRYDSSKISFLLAIPALTGASVLSLKDILNQSFEINYFVFLSIVLSFLFSYFTVKFFLKYINKFSLNIFVIYRIIIALFLFLIIYN